MPSSVAAATDGRYERKFVVRDLTPEEVEHLVRLHPALFRQVYPPRQVDNLYLDSFDAKSYFENLDGVRDRVKVRIRWYGELFGAIERPALELKIKRGLVGRKESYRLPAFTLRPGFDREVLAELFAGAELPERLRLLVGALSPALLNRYRRKYLLSADGRVRLTLDDDLEFFRASARNNSFLSCRRDRISTILELKFSGENGDRAAQIAARFPFRLTKSSKYVTGVQGLESW